MYSDVWKWAGEFRKSDKNIGVNWIKIGKNSFNISITNRKTAQYS